MNRFAPLVQAFAEVVEGGWLLGPFRDYVLVVDPGLLALWQRIAPNQAMEPPGQIGTARKRIIFDVGDACVSLLEQQKSLSEPRASLSFLSEYYPSVCAKTFAAGEMSDHLGSGLVMFQTPRTGSHLLQGMIAQLGDFGAPEEWVRPPVIKAVQLGILSLVDHMYRCARHQRAFHKYWATSLVLPFLAEIWGHLSDHEQGRLLSFVEHSHPFLLTRRDRIAQTWSQIRAYHTGRFHAFVQKDVNEQAEVALLPVEKFWLWVILNRRHFDRLESFARSIAAKSNKNLSEVAYEELQERPLTEALHGKVLGEMYSPLTHRLDPDATIFLKQSSVHDAECIASLGQLISQITGPDFRDWQNVRHSSMTMSGTVVLETGRLELRGGSLECRVPFEYTEQRATIALQFELFASEHSPASIRMMVGTAEVCIATMKRPGAYLLLAANTILLGGLVRFIIELGANETICARVSPIYLYIGSNRL